MSLAVDFEFGSKHDGQLLRGFKLGVMKFVLENHLLLGGVWIAVRQRRFRGISQETVIWARDAAKKIKCGREITRDVEI